MREYSLENWRGLLLKTAEEHVENEEVVLAVLETFSSLTEEEDLPWAFLCRAGLLALLHRSASSVENFD